MTDIQAMLNAFNDIAKANRSDYHLTLGELIDVLEKCEDKKVTVLVQCIGEPNTELAICNVVNSYRGYYSDLAIEFYNVQYSTKERDIVTVGDILKTLKDALHETFEGYKGGEYVMEEDTPLWLGYYGESSGLAILGVETTKHGVTLFVKDISESF